MKVYLDKCVKEKIFAGDINGILLEEFIYEIAFNNDSDV